MRKVETKNKIIALAGNPNVGKSTLFNALTGMNQHTGNWAGKTVTNAIGRYKDSNYNFTFVDIPGTYSLMAHSEEEKVARDYLIFGQPDATVVVCDATCLERNLNLTLQILEISKRVVVCVNLMDEAEKKGIKINLNELSQKLGVPVIGTNARGGKGIKLLIKTLDLLFKDEKDLSPITIKYPNFLETAVSFIENALTSKYKCIPVNSKWLALKILEGDEKLLESFEKEFKLNITSEIADAVIKAKDELKNQKQELTRIKDYIVSALVLTAEEICSKEVISFTYKDYKKRDLKIDKFLTGKITGPLVLLGLLAVIFWITISAANYPSQLIWKFFVFAEGKLLEFANYIKIPGVISNMLLGGVFRVTGWVISVMLPPMAIFFPIFTLLEDLGFLPRLAFNLDKSFQKCSACGKQALTMCMGLGCNAVGVTGCRIIDSKREQLIAILTNSLVPCNGRFPTLIAIITIFLSSAVGFVSDSLFSAAILAAVILMSIFFTFLISKLLSITILKGQPSSFTLELPPYRAPKIASVIVRSVLDRTVFVLGRAVAVAAPAGLIIWVLANTYFSGEPLLNIISEFLDPFGRLIGLDGVILLGFILGFPANEIVIPIIIMAYLGGGTLTDYGSLAELKNILISNGWTIKTAICTIVFSLMHWPCSTTILTIKKETGSYYWAFMSFIIPTLCGMILCFIINLISNIF